VEARGDSALRRPGRQSRKESATAYGFLAGRQGITLVLPKFFAMKRIRINHTTEYHYNQRSPSVPIAR
jgi:hypothetical protein